MLLVWYKITRMVCCWVEGWKMLSLSRGTCTTMSQHYTLTQRFITLWNPAVNDVTKDFTPSIYAKYAIKSGEWVCLRALASFHSLWWGQGQSHKSDNWLKLHNQPSSCKLLSMAVTFLFRVVFSFYSASEVCSIFRQGIHRKASACVAKWVYVHQGKTKLKYSSWLCHKFPDHQEHPCDVRDSRCGL